MVPVDFYTICTNLTKYMLKDIHSGSSHMNVVGLIDKLTVVLLTFKSNKLPVTKCQQLFWCQVWQVFICTSLFHQLNSVWYDIFSLNLHKCSSSFLSCRSWPFDLCLQRRPLESITFKTLSLFCISLPCFSLSACHSGFFFYHKNVQKV